MIFAANLNTKLAHEPIMRAMFCRQNHRCGHAQRAISETKIAVDAQIVSLLAVLTFTWLFFLRFSLDAPERQVLASSATMALSGLVFDKKKDVLPSSCWNRCPNRKREQHDHATYCGQRGKGNQAEEVGKCRRLRFRSSTPLIGC
jgi:hypothetical protein